MLLRQATLASSFSNTGEPMHKRMPVTALVLASALALTACAPPGESEPVPSLTAPHSASQTPSVGDVVVPEPNMTHPSPWSMANRPYRMLDGTYVLVSPRQALPKPVRTDIEKRLASIAPAMYGASKDEAESTWTAFSRLAAQIRDETGRPVVIFSMTVVPSSGLARWVHFGGTARENIPSYDSIPGGEMTAQEYEAKVFERSNESFFDVFFR